MWCRLSVNTQLLAKVDQLFKVSCRSQKKKFPRNRRPNPNLETEKKRKETQGKTNLVINMIAGIIGATPASNKHSVPVLIQTVRTVQTDN